MRRGLPLVLAVAAALVALDLLYLMAFGASAPHWFEPPRRRLQAGSALICSALAAAWLLRARSWRSAATHPLFVGQVLTTLLMANIGAMGSGDTRATSYLPLALVRHQSFSFPEPEHAPHTRWRCTSSSPGCRRPARCGTGSG